MVSDYNIKKELFKYHPERAYTVELAKDFIYQLQRKPTNQVSLLLVWLFSEYEKELLFLLPTLTEILKKVRRYDKIQDLKRDMPKIIEEISENFEKTLEVLKNENAEA